MPTSIPEPRREAVNRALTGAFGTTVLDAVAPISGGLSGAGLYRIRVGGIAYVLRIEPPAHAFGDPARGFACMRTAAEAFLAPRVRYADPVDGVAIMDLVAQRSLALDYPGDGKPLIVELAQAVRLLHETPPFPPLVDYMAGMQMVIGQQLQSGLLDPSVFHELMELYAGLTAVYRTAASDRVSSHNDLNPGNVLFDGTRLWLVDWEYGGFGTPLFDLANLFQDCGAVGDRQMRFDLDEDVALADRLSDARYCSLAWNDTAAIDALHDAAAVWIGNDPTNQIEGRAYRLRFGDGRTDIQQALGRLGGEDRAVLQAPRCIAESLRRR